MASKANRLRSEEGEEKEKPSRKSKDKKGGVRGAIRSFRSFLADERTHKVFGLTVLLVSFYMLVAFASNLFTWQEDQAVAGADNGSFATTWRYPTGWARSAR
jgi:S-DNA-T family DNA segregation ATPase FtsK/SpoIIIE